MIDVTQNMTEEEKGIFVKYKDTFPFPVVKFANDLGIKVFASDLPSNMSGAISKNDAGYVIFVNGKQSPRRIRFTLAHELGHFFKDKSYLEQNGKISDSSKQSSKWLFRDEDAPPDPAMRSMDAKANQFAAELLMPEAEFIRLWEKSTSPEQVAKYFDVSVDAVKIRAASLLGEIV